MKAIQTTLALALVFAAGAARAELAYAVTIDNRLVSFDTANPTQLLSVTAITGQAAFDLTLGIDFRPATGELYGVGSSNTLYRINTGTGVASAVGAPFTPPLSGVEFGFDFNPTVDRIRLTSDNGQNLRLHPVTGQVVAIDGTLNFAGGDPNFGQNPNVVASAYTNNFAGATITTLYNIDSRLDVLVSQIPPNSGTLNTIGSLGMDVSSLAGFDISGGTAIAYAAVVRQGDFRSWLTTVNLATGGLTPIAPIGGNDLLIRDLAVVPEPATIAIFGALGILAARRRRRG
ncbi:MAG: DUF4394 domain-containing protein [Fimbriimonadaceae bacterium]